MKSRLHLDWCLALLSCFPAATRAQSVVPPPVLTAADSVVTRSPFEVSADKDTGSAATNTLAGTRASRLPSRILARASRSSPRIS